MNSSVKDILIPTAVLTIICIVVSAALSITYGITTPIIEGNKKAEANKALIEVLPEADDFDEKTDGLPEGVTNIYTAKNGAGTVVKLAVSGYGGPVTMMVGISSEMTISGVTVLENSETQGLGSKAMDPAYTSQYAGKSSPDEVESISGATVSSKALKSGIQLAIDASQAAKE